MAGLGWPESERVALDVVLDVAIVVLGVMVGSGLSGRVQTSAG